VGTLPASQSATWSRAMNEIEILWEWALNQLTTHGILSHECVARLQAYGVEPKFVEAVYYRLHRPSRRGRCCQD